MDKHRGLLPSRSLSNSKHFLFVMLHLMCEDTGNKATIISITIIIISYWYKKCFHNLQRRTVPISSTLWLSWRLTVDLKKKGKVNRVYLVSVRKAGGSDPNAGVRCPFVCFLCVRSERENKLIYIFFRRWQLYYYTNKKKGLWPIKSLTQQK